ncbi:hypothetical protein L873DRAFT_281945 [Choiromyces venosus 120613-1]|uniref:Transmembrane protein n=1 Tax=Choiromyces venosus 120613-1 TaxID=1336337 RepID=A0A3N4JY30_9PEZI|nr:hypothetical protein L873DRAFT_281945 [Choiromyces venosus 120613-1]
MPVDASPFFPFSLFHSFHACFLGFFFFSSFSFSPAGLFRLLWCFSLFSSTSSFCFFSFLLFHFFFFHPPRGWLVEFSSVGGLGTRTRLLKRNNEEGSCFADGDTERWRGKQRFLFGEAVVGFCFVLFGSC